MPDYVRYEVRDRVAILTIDNPPVNALGAGVWEAVGDAAQRGADDPGADALVLTGAGQTFVAGADINIFKTLKTRDDSLARSARTHALLVRLENTPKPLVAAIHGHALGGGLELAMACHYRVATRGAVVGQPEVSLGIIPGAGGTQRLPRLAGAATALEMCAGGKPVPAPIALAAGIVDQIVDGDLVENAIAFAKARARAGDIRKTREIAIGDADGARAICAQFRASFRAPPGIAAPSLAITAIEGAFTLSFDAGSLRERELFADCVVSTESKALRHLFFAEREASKVPGVPKETRTVDIRRAAVVGAGTMGGGIAMTYANAGIPVLLKDVDEASLQRGLVTIRKNYESSVAKGRLTAGQLERTLALITPTTTYDAFDTVDIVVEAVFENMTLKTATFVDLGRVDAARLRARIEHLDARHRRARGRERPGRAGRRASFLQPREHHETPRNRSGKSDESGDARHVGEAGEAAVEGWRRRGQLLRLRRQPHARLLHARGLPAARRGRERPADRPRADGLWSAGRTVRHAGHRRHRRQRADPPASRRDRQSARRGSAIRRARSAVRHGTLRPENRRRLVSRTSRAAARAFPIR